MRNLGLRDLGSRGLGCRHGLRIWDWDLGIYGFRLQDAGFEILFLSGM